MTSADKRQIRQLLTVICLIILCAIAGYLCGHREASKLNNDLKLQMKIDTLETCLDISMTREIELRDSIKKNNDARYDRIDIIEAVKKTIRNEIKKSTQSVYIVPDSLHQRFIDSIRSRQGFNKIQYK